MKVKYVKASSVFTPIILMLETPEELEAMKCWAMNGSEACYKYKRNDLNNIQFWMYEKVLEAVEGMK